MRKLFISLIFILGPTLALAGSPTPGTYDPPVLAPAAPSWGGVYGGIGITTEREETRERHEIVTQEEVKTEENTPTGEYESSCTSDNPQSHNGNKCQISDEVFEHLRDTGQFEVVNQPWRKNLDGPVIYDNGSYKGIWMNGESEVSFTTTSPDPAPTDANKGADYHAGDEIIGVTVVTTIVESIEEIFTVDEDEKVTANAFVGYRHVFKSGFAGGIELGTVGGAEAQMGFSQGRWFAYTGYNSDEENTLGVDVLMGQQGRWFLGGKVANGDHTRGELRVGFHF